MLPTHRLIFGFLIAPAAPWLLLLGVTETVMLWTSQGDPLPIVFLCGIVASYLPGLILGVAAFAIARKIRRTGLLASVVGGAIVGCVIGVAYGLVFYRSWHLMDAGLVEQWTNTTVLRPCRHSLFRDGSCRVAAPALGDIPAGPVNLAFTMTAPCSVARWGAAPPAERDSSVP